MTADYLSGVDCSTKTFYPTPLCGIRPVRDVGASFPTQVTSRRARVWCLGQLTSLLSEMFCKAGNLKYSKIKSV